MVTRIIGPASIVTIPPPVVNGPPVWASVPSPSFTVGTPAVFPMTGTYQLNGIVTDPEHDPITITWNKSPQNGVSWDGGRWVYDGAGTGNIGGNFLTADDGQGNSVSTPSSFTITITTITPINVAPVWGFISPSFTEGVTSIYNFPVTDADGDSMNTAVGATSATYPAWLSIVPTPPPRLQATTPPLGTVPATLKAQVDDSHGHVIESPAFGVTVVAAPVLIDSWTKISSPSMGTAVFGGNGGGNIGAHTLCVENSGLGRIWQYCDWYNVYDPVTNLWTTSNNFGRKENYGSYHDPVDNTIHWSAGGPDSMDDNGAPVTDGRVRVYNIASNTFTDDITHSFTNGSAGSNCCYVIDLNIRRLYAFGGYTSTSGDLVYRDLPSGIWVLANPTGDIPALSNNPNGVGGAADSTRYTGGRGGCDQRTGQLWVVGDGNELYVYNPPTNRWTRIPTSSPKPPACSVFGLYETKNCIVAYCGDNNLLGGNPAIIKRETWILDLGTLVWRQSVTGAGTPHGNVAGGQQFLYDRVRDRMLNCTFDSNTFQCQVWRVDIGELGP